MINDEDSILPKSTRPLPYVQIGMLLVHPDDSATWWEVEEIHDLDAPEATLRSNDARRVTWPCPDIRKRFRLYEDFDPNIERDLP